MGFGFLGWTSILQADPGVPREACFPLERLSPELRARGEEILLKLLDSEALFTVVGGLKPVSESFTSVSFSDSEDSLAKLDQLREILACFRCGDEFYADVLIFHRPFGESRRGSAYIAYRPRVEDTIARHPSVFARHGLTRHSHPAELMKATDHADGADRWRLFGHLFGYPDDAVEFFVTAGQASEKDSIAPRRFLNIPVHSLPTGRFVYAVAPEHVETETDRDLRVQAAGILAEYRRRREAYIGDGKRGVLELIRDWFDDGQGNHSAAHATFAIPATFDDTDSRAGLPTTTEPMPVYSDEPGHRLNRIHALLFITERVPAEVVASLPEERSASRTNATTFYQKGWYFEKRPGEPQDLRIFGGDLRVSPVESLTADEASELRDHLDAICDARAVDQMPELSDPTTRLMLQWDLVQLFDRWERSQAVDKPTLAKMARAIAALAQPRDVLAGLPSGLDRWHGLSERPEPIEVSPAPRADTSPAEPPAAESRESNTSDKANETEEAAPSQSNTSPSAPDALKTKTPETKEDQVATSDQATSDKAITITRRPPELPPADTVRYVPADLADALQGQTTRWVEVGRRSTTLFHAAKSLRTSRVFLAGESRDVAEDLIRAVTLADDDASIPTPPLGVETALVLTLCGFDEQMRPVATPVIDEIRVRRLDGPIAVSADNPTTSKDGWNQWIYFRSRASGPPSERDPFEQIANTRQTLFLEYGTAKHSTFAAQCVLCHRTTHHGGQAPLGIRSLSRFGKPTIVDEPRHRFELAEDELSDLGERLRQYQTAPAADKEIASETDPTSETGSPSETKSESKTKTTSTSGEPASP